MKKGLSPALAGFTVQKQQTKPVPYVGCGRRQHLLCNHVGVVIMAAQISQSTKVMHHLKPEKGNLCAGRWTGHSVVYHMWGACTRETRPFVCGESLPVP